MKKLVLTMLVVALAIPAMAADISLVDNGDDTGTIVLTVTGDEVVRGLAIVVQADADITAVTGTAAIFNVFMDAAFTAEAAEAGSYELGGGTPIADPDAAGELALAAGVTKISLCMGILDESEAQGGAVAGTYTVATIATCGGVTITADTLRGGIVGDDLDAATIAGGTVVCGGGVCVGDIVEDGILGIPDLQALVGLLGNSYDLVNPALPFLGSEYALYPADADYPANAAVYNYDQSADGIIGIPDLQAMTADLGNNYHLINPALPFLGSEYSFPCPQ